MNLDHDLPRAKLATPGVGREMTTRRRHDGLAGGGRRRGRLAASGAPPLAGRAAVRVLVVVVLLLLALFLFLLLDPPGGDRGAAAIADPDERETPERSAPVAARETDPAAEPARDRAADTPAVEPDDEPEAARSHEPRYFGRVVDDGDGYPLQDARVRPHGKAEVSPGERAGALRAVRTDEDGIFELPRGHGSVAWWIEADGYGPAVLRTAGVEDHRSRERAREFRLRSSATLRVRVKDSAGAALADTDVVLETKGYELTPGPVVSRGFVGDAFEWRGTTGLGGRCEIAGLPPDTVLRPSLRHGDRSRKIEEPVTLRAGETRAVDWILGGGGRIEGLVRDLGGAPVPGEEIWLLRSSLAGAPRAGAVAYLSSSDQTSVVKTSRTGPDGRFALEDVAAGTWWVGVAASRRRVRGSGAAPVARGVEVRDGETTSTEIPAARGLALRGRVVDSEGEPVRFARVSARPVELHGRRFESTERDGTFVLGPLADVAHELRARAAGRRSEGVVVAAGEDDVVELRLGASGTLRGRVEGIDGSVTDGVRVTVQGDDLLMMTDVKRDGTFEQEVPPGVYHLSASAPSGHVAIATGISAKARERSEEAVLRLEPGARVRIRYDGEARVAQYRVFSGEANVGADGIHSGTVRDVFVPAGPVRVELRGGESREAREVVASHGRATEVHFDLR